MDDLIAAFPSSEVELVLIADGRIDPSMADKARFRTEQDLRIRNARISEQHPEQVILTVGRMRSIPTTVDTVIVEGLRLAERDSVGEAVSPPFVHGIQEPMGVKLPHFEPAFPHASTLVGVHVSVMCCTGCNGGVHDRGLVALNSHVAGPWSGIWIRSNRGIEAPYARWQRVLCTGGVIAEEEGSTTVADLGWMSMRPWDETPHHPPPPLRLSTEDLPVEQTDSLICKSLDAAWVEFADVSVESVMRSSDEGRLPHTQLVVSDRSEGRASVRLYQPSAASLKSGVRMNLIRGFVHAERPGVYVVLSDKEEDLIV